MVPPGTARRGTQLAHCPSHIAQFPGKLDKCIDKVEARHVWANVFADALADGRAAAEQVPDQQALALANLFKEAELVLKRVVAVNIAAMDVEPAKNTIKVKKARLRLCLVRNWMRGSLHARCPARAGWVCSR